MTSTNPPSPQETQFWEERYQNQSTPWDLGQPAPPFRRLLETRQGEFPVGQVAVVGSGKGHDAALFGQAGYTVTGLDYAPSAIKTASETYGQLATFQQVDLFQLPSKLIAQFDYVIEHTCFCAILPQQRPDYVNAVARLLKPKGKLIGLFFAHHEDGGPPFKTDLMELQAIFSSQFEFLEATIPPDSIPERQEQELMVILQKR